MPGGLIRRLAEIDWRKRDDGWRCSARGGAVRVEPGGRLVFRRDSGRGLANRVAGREHPWSKDDAPEGLGIGGLEQSSDGSEARPSLGRASPLPLVTDSVMDIGDDG